MPKLSERSKVIGKGTSYNEKIEKRKQGKSLIGPSQGGNRLNQKKLKDTIKVPGMAMTAQQKKQLAKKKKRKEKAALLTTIDEQMSGVNSDSSEAGQEALSEEE